MNKDIPNKFIVDMWSGNICVKKQNPRVKSIKLFIRILQKTNVINFSCIKISKIREIGHVSIKLQDCFTRMNIGFI